MPWITPQPQPAQDDRERLNFLREIWSRLKWGTVTFTPVSVASLAARTYLVAASGGDVTTNAAIGLRVGMPVTVTWPSAPSTGLILDCWCDAADTLKVRFQNFSAGPLTPPAGAYAFKGVVI